MGKENPVDEADRRDIEAAICILEQFLADPASQKVQETWLSYAGDQIRKVLASVRYQRHEEGKLMDDTTLAARLWAMCLRRFASGGDEPELWVVFTGWDDDGDMQSESYETREDAEAALNDAIYNQEETCDGTADV